METGPTFNLLVFDIVDDGIADPWSSMPLIATGATLASSLSILPRSHCLTLGFAIVSDERIELSWCPNGEYQGSQSMDRQI